MLATPSPTSEAVFTKDAVLIQLQKIINDPVFQYSQILKSFLSFIVNETLDGRSNCLKEYTIAVNVLEKPADFNPQGYALVRIHAGRLRSALERYYTESGQSDLIRICIPKGSYVPSFLLNNYLLADHSYQNKKSTIIGVAPFSFLDNGLSKNSFSAGLGTQLSAHLMRYKNFSVVAHFIMKRLFARESSLQEIKAATGADLVITGGIQVFGEIMRIHMQVIRTSNSHLLFSHMFECSYESCKIFEAQDEIVGQMLSELIAMENAA